ncbi:SURF1 family protein [Fontimonas sp. SYSU GA230001]|uniref:SURF1 family protein n=1 Tax=Fontimonas sp. SYSU GA230001 TaxID=3142450 RepID=UPI0032B4C3F2
MAKKRFRPAWWAVVLVLVGVGTTVGLGIWQLQRGLAKAALIEHYRTADTMPPRQVTSGAWADPDAVQRGWAVGRFDADMQLLLDNQSRNRVPGYHVWTPLRLPDGGTVLVDRGWIPADGDRSKLPALPAPTGEMRVEGYWKPLPRPGMRLDVDNCAGGPWPRIVQYPTVEELRCLYGNFVPDGILLLDPGLPGGFARDWAAGPEMSPSKHYAYAGQWFVFALLILGIFVKFSFRSPE